MSTADERRADERARRELANKHRGDVIEGSGTAITSRRLAQVVSLRLEPDLIVALRELAAQRGTTISELLRQGALLLLADASAPVRVGVVQFELAATPAVTSIANARYDNSGLNVEYAQSSSYAVTG